MDRLIAGAVDLIGARVAYANANGLSPRVGATYRSSRAPWRKVWHTMEAPEDDPDTRADEGWELPQIRDYIIRHRTPPHLWALPKHDVVFQTVPLTFSAYALRHNSSDPETNHAHAIQTEVIGYAKDGLTDPDLCDWLGRRVLGPIIKAGVPINVGIAAPSTGSDGYGTNGRVRMTWQQWANFNGQCGHANVPGNCVTADTPVLCADLQWRPAGDLLVGDELIAFDEESPNQAGRRFRRATVTHNELRRDALLRVNTPAGSVRCNREHPWLVRRGAVHKWGSWRWVPASELEPGDEVMFVLEPWQVERTWDAGWLAGMYDGEGSLSVIDRHGVYLSVAQRVSPTADEMIQAVKERVDASVIKRWHPGANRQPMVQVGVQRRDQVMRMLGMVRPARLLAKADAVWEGGSLGKTGQRVTVESVESWGTGTIAALSTSTRTYIAAGFAMHNSHWDPGRADYLRIARAAGNPTPDEDWFDMRTDNEIIALFQKALNSQCSDIRGIGGGDKPFATALEYIYWGGRDATRTRAVANQIAAKVDALDGIDETEVARLVLEGFDAEAITAAIPDDLAEQVVGLLGKKLTTPG